MFDQVYAKIFQTFLVGFRTPELTVGDEDDTINPFENELSTGTVKHVTWYRIQVKSRFITAYFPK